MANPLTVSVVEGDKVELSDGVRPFPVSFLLSPAEAEEVAYAILDACEEAARGGEPTAAQLEAMNNPDSQPYHEWSPSFRRAMGEAGRARLLNG